MNTSLLTLTVCFSLILSISETNCSLSCAIDNGESYPIGHNSNLLIARVISAYGYSGIKHEIPVHNGYILTVYQIHPKKTCQKMDFNTCSNVIIMGHGWMLSSYEFVLNEEALAFRLAERCFDVFLVNFRATTYGSHKKYSTDSKEYWKFNMDDQIKDLPYVVEYIKGYMLTHKVIYIGHAMGATFMFGALSNSRDLQKKVCCFIPLSPVFSFVESKQHIRIARVLSELLLLSRFVKPIGSLGKMTQKIKQFGSSMATFPELRRVVLRSLAYFDEELPSCINPMDLVNITSHFPGGASVLTTKQLLKNINEKNPQLAMMDYGPTKNLAIYGKVKPDVYNLTQIVCTGISLVTTKNDLWVQEEDVKGIISRLLTFKERYDMSLSSHLCMAWGCNNFEHYTNIIGLLKKCYHNCWW